MRTNRSVTRLRSQPHRQHRKLIGSNYNPQTHEGAPADLLTPEQQLARDVLACFLFEDGYYEDGDTIANRIFNNALLVNPQRVSDLAARARHDFHLRHVPLLLTAVLTRTGASLVSDTVQSVVQRPDEMGELLALYGKLFHGDATKVKPLSKQLQKGLAAVFGRFDEYQLSKYDRSSVVRLKDVLFLSHAKPRDEAQALLWKTLIGDVKVDAPVTVEGTDAEGEFAETTFRRKAKKLATADTWETNLSAGADKQETFERLLRSNKMGYLALLRNLRNMDEAGVDPALVEEHIRARRGAQRVLPFRYLSAMRHAPRYVSALDDAFQRSIEVSPPFAGNTLVLIDCSGSMSNPVSGRSEITRLDAAATIAAAIRSGKKRVFGFAESIAEIPALPGLAGIEAVHRCNVGHMTRMGAAIAHLGMKLGNVDRLIVVGDEQSQDPIPPNPFRRATIINVASNAHGVDALSEGYTRVSGFSERILDYLRLVEEEEVG